MTQRFGSSCSFTSAIWCICALGGLLAQANAAESTRGADWSVSKPPAGWSRGAYDPSQPAPNFGTGEGVPAQTDGKPYDPYHDPYHPLKDPTQDPGEAWNDVPGRGPRDGSPGVQSNSADWQWGERYFDEAFEASIVITNNCSSPQPVRIYVNDLPYLTLPDSITVPPGQTRVSGNVKLPPEPPPPIRLGLPGEPGWGHVEFPPFIPLGFPPPKLHQPNFVPIVGSVVTWHPWAPSDPNGCLPKRQTYTVSGHIHFRPPPPRGGGPEKVASPSVCQVYWNIGVPPAQYQGEDCAPEMRELAHAYRERVLQTYALNAPEEWGWLPSAEQLRTLEVPQLLEMKVHADSLTGARR